MSSEGHECPKRRPPGRRLSGEGPRVLLAFALAVVGCASARLGADATGGPSVVMPAHFAERENAAKATKPAGSNEHAADAGPSVAVNQPPDPPPLVTRSQWLYRFKYDKGNVIVADVVKKEFERPVPTERRVGRFAVELWVGRELVERVRFDFPLLAADPAPEGRKQPLRQPAAFGPGAETSREVLVPTSDRATRAILVDRLNGHSIPLAWPPDAIEPAKSRTPGP